MRSATLIASFHLIFVSYMQHYWYGCILHFTPRTCDRSLMTLSKVLQNRARELEMSITDLARRSGVSRATVIRILGGKDQGYTVSNLQSILTALGMTMDLLEIPAEQFKEAIALQKAQRLIALTQGNVALESKAVSATSAQAHLGATKTRIASSRRKLWAS